MRGRGTQEREILDEVLVPDFFDTWNDNDIASQYHNDGDYC